MSDSDDWENAVDDVIEDKPVAEEKKVEDGKFNDEDNVDSDDERKQAAEEKKKKQAEQAKEPKKVKTSKKDYEAMYAKRMGAGASTAADLAAAGKKGEAISMAAEQDITDALFSQDLGTDANGLRSESNYVKFATQVGDILYEGQTPYNIPSFYVELAKGLQSAQLSSLDMKKIVDSITVAYNAKVAEEKKSQGGKGKKGKEKPKIAGGKGADNSRNNNPAMVADLMGDDYGDEYGEYGDYGDESGTGAKKVAEPE